MRGSKNNKKIIYISHWRIPSEKTMSPLIMKTCEGLADSGFEVELWLPWRRNPSFRGIETFKYHGVKNNFLIKRLPALDGVVLMPNKTGFYLLVASFNISVFFYALFRGIIKSAVFYAHDTRDAILLILFKPKIFFEIHDFYKSSVDFINKLGFSRASGLIVTNKYKMEKINKEYGIPLEKMLHQPNAVDVEKFSPNISKEEARKKLDLSKDKKIVLYTGHLFGWKGVDILLELAKYLPEDQVVYFVGGTNEDIADFKNKKDKLGIGDNVIIAGRKPHDEIPLWQRAADVLVLPNTAKEEASKYETSPVKLFEYMASGTPMVASDLPSIRNVVNENMVWFFEADNAGNLSQVIQESMNNEKESRDKAVNAKKEVKKYTWENRSRSIINFIS
jgi:glycosyltransferase involved in cell wall biosynthesis